VAPEYHELPPDLPVPEDDGAADHLAGAELPSLRLPVAGDGELDLAQAAAGTLALFVYPRTGTPGVPLPPGWDEIPGARGCTPQTCSFRDRFGELSQLGAAIVGVSAMDPDEQAAFAEREAIPYPLLNDRSLRLRDELGLPVFEVAGMTLYKRLALIARGGNIVTAFYPVFPPDQNAAQVSAWLRENPA
jgi:peroxiredoxin